jgi:16S rRNA (guanine527-N7)-methyltransferase
VTDPEGHAGLLEVLHRARDLGFLGPGPVEAHIGNAASFLEALAGTTGTVLDLGTGGGVPGLVVGVARPDLELVLLESRTRRCEHLQAAADALGLQARIAEGRAETLARTSLRGTLDAVLARSFGSPAVTAECGAPFLRVGGVLLVSEPPGPPRAERWPERPLDALGLEVGSRVGHEPAVQVLRQVRACPETAPRREGLPAKRPLF